MAERSHLLLRLTGAQYDATLAGIRLLATSLANRLVLPDDGDIGDILTSSGAHAGLTSDEVYDLGDSWQVSVPPKAEALNWLRVALSLATESGLFDDMAADVHPNVINRFCDAVAAESGRPINFDKLPAEPTATERALARYSVVDGMGADGDQFAILDGSNAEHLPTRYDTEAEAETDADRWNGFT